MTVPETAIHKHHGLVFGEHEVWFPWQVAAMKPVTKTAGMKPAPYNHFRLCVLTPDSSHIAATGRLVMDIRQLRPSEPLPVPEAVSEFEVP